MTAVESWKYLLDLMNIPDFREGKFVEFFFFSFIDERSNFKQRKNDDDEREKSRLWS